MISKSNNDVSLNDSIVVYVLKHRPVVSTCSSQYAVLGLTRLVVSE